MDKFRCQCGGLLDVEYVHLMVVKASVNPATGEYGKPRKVADGPDEGEPKFTCRKCKKQYVPKEVVIKSPNFTVNGK